MRGGVGSELGGAARAARAARRRGGGARDGGADLVVGCPPTANGKRFGSFREAALFFVTDAVGSTIFASGRTGACPTGSCTEEFRAGFRRDVECRAIWADPEHADLDRPAHRDDRR